MLGLCCSTHCAAQLAMPQQTFQHLLLCLLQSLEAIEEQVLPMRKELHQLLGLPMDRPMLRMANAMAFDDAAGEACGQINVQPGDCTYSTEVLKYLQRPHPAAVTCAQE